MIEPEGYCRAIEAYLCRKNDGHLIRIAGPAFERVTRWAHEGIPVKVAYAGIDRYFERYYRRGPRRRPVRIEFCEADVRDVFDAWRRAVGVTWPVAALSTATGAGDAGAQTSEDERAGPRRRESLSLHIERTIARLTTLRASSQFAHTFQDSLEHVVRELDTVQPEAKRARGDARDGLLARLAALDRLLMAAILESLDEHVRDAAEAEAKDALAPFRVRMTPDAYQRACAAATEKHVREHFGVPAIRFE